MGRFDLALGRKLVMKETPVDLEPDPPKKPRLESTPSGANELYELWSGSVSQNYWPTHPINVTEYRRWLRHFYQTDMSVVNFIDSLVHQAAARITWLPRGFTTADLHHAVHEFYLFGNAYMTTHPRGGWTFFDPDDIRVRPVPMTGSYQYEYLQGDRPPSRRSTWIELPNLIHLARRRSAYDTLGTPIILIHMGENGNTAVAELPLMDAAYHAAGFSTVWENWISRDNGVHFNSFDASRFTN